MQIFDLQIGDAIYIGDIKVMLFPPFKQYNRNPRLGVHAPKHIKIWRKEIYDKVQAEKQAETQAQSKPTQEPTCKK